MHRKGIREGHTFPAAQLILPVFHLRLMGTADQVLINISFWIHESWYVMPVYGYIL